MWRKWHSESSPTRGGSQQVSLVDLQSWFHQYVSPKLSFDLMIGCFDLETCLSWLPIRVPLSQQFALANVTLGRGRWAVSQKCIMIRSGFRLGQGDPQIGWLVFQLHLFSLLSYSQHKSFFWDYRSFKPLKSCLDPYSSCLAETLTGKLRARGFAFSFQFHFR